MPPEVSMIRYQSIRLPQLTLTTAGVNRGAAAAGGNDLVGGVTAVLLAGVMTPATVSVETSVYPTPWDCTEDREPSRRLG